MSDAIDGSQLCAVLAALDRNLNLAVTVHHYNHRNIIYSDDFAGHNHHPTITQPSPNHHPTITQPSPNHHPTITQPYTAITRPSHSNLSFELILMLHTHISTHTHARNSYLLSGPRFIPSWGRCNSSMLLVLYSFILHRSFTRIVHTLVHTRSTRLAHAAHSRITINPIRSFRSIIQRRSHLSHSSVITHRHSLFEHSHTNARTTRCCHS